MRQPKLSLRRRVSYGLLFAGWTVVSFVFAQLFVLAVLWVGAKLGLTLPFVLNETVLQTTVSIVVYLVTIVTAVGVPWKLLGQRLSWGDVGLAQQLPRWRDIGLAPVAFVAALVVTGIAMYVASLVIPGVDLETKQQVGFENITQRYEMLLAFFTLVVLAPICEEFLFRGYLYGRVRKYYSALWAVVLTSLVFGLMHVYAGPGMPLQWNVMIATTVLALFIGALREYTGSIWAGILVHMLKNGVAFFALFIAPLLGISLVQ
ncbi:CPBP family intramembrane glutamic endopeptidase [Candidatus Mycosynbacter amalyticus]|uniref:CPBP family intramembrane glutamic endopeptidase n=1 Tax=Candidatus Mycosynbacter amalyticus TaxID=2665156 RepID=UPI0021B16DEC|nr:type II CAAX endopeptidase family protein [Candidatus Mycosynbacter amalyticus]